jgi:LPXTG-motif cell wall-anchored protein
LDDGEHTVTAEETDEAGNVGTDDKTFVIDTVPPVVTINDPQPGDEFNNQVPWDVSGLVTEPDGVTPVPGATVNVTNKGPNGTPGELLCSAVADATGAWSCQVAAGKPGGDGEYTIQAVATDPAGNVSQPAEVTVKVDNTVPAVRITEPTPNQWVKDEPITVRGTGETPGDTVVVSDGHGHNCSATVQADHTWSCLLADVPEGDQTLTATETDRAGNVGTDSVPIKVDRTPPPAPPVLYPENNGYLDETTPTFVGTGDQPGDVIDIYEDGTLICQTTVRPDKTWQCPVTTPLVDGPHSFTVTETDPAGNVSQPTVVVTTPGTAITPEITYPVDGSKTNDGQPTVQGTIPGTGTVDPGTVVQVQVPGTNNQCTATVQPDRTWQCKLPQDLGDDGPKTITAVTVSPSGKVSAPDSVTFELDRTPPFIIPDTTDPGHIGVDTEPNADVEIKNEDGKTICTAKADDQGHAICVPQPGDVPKPGDEITIISTDEAGNTSEKVVRIVQVVVADKEIVLPGETQQTATGYYFQPGEKVHGVSVHGSVTTDLGWQTADATGKVVFTWSITDSDASLGDHTVTLTGDYSGPGRDTFQVSRQADLPKTGAGAESGLMTVAVAAATLGLGLVLLGWRRRRQDQELASARRVS